MTFSRPTSLAYLTSRLAISSGCSMKSLAWPFGGEDLLLRIASQFEESPPLLDYSSADFVIRIADLW